MDYEEKYKEALEKAQIYRNHLIKTGDDTNEIEYIFPELINEDERIREEILSVVKQFDKNTTLCGKNYDYNKWITWLEKQGEQKPSWSEEDEKFFNTALWYISNSISNCKGTDINYDTTNWLKSLKNRIKEFNNTEPKFKVGDWVVYNDANVYQIKEIDYTKIIPRYELENIDGDKLSIPFTSDYNLRNWTINDANDGDVLYCKNNGIEYIVMNKDINERGNINSYFRYNSLNGFGIDIPSVLSVKYDNITPATKEQRDFLFSKMKEVGCEWNANTKQLIKKQS